MYMRCSPVYTCGHVLFVEMMPCGLAVCVDMQIASVLYLAVSVVASITV